MARVAQIGIALAALGIILILMGLFPGVTGLQPTVGIGIMQIFTILSGMALLMTGGLIYVKFMFYPFTPATLAQQIGVRLALTGFILSGMAGLADVLGFGSNPPTPTSDMILGPWQAAGVIGGFALSSLGVLLYAVSGTFGGDDEHEEDHN